MRFGVATTVIVLLSVLRGAIPASASDPTRGTVNVRLVWTAPGGDGWVGQAAQYELRYSTVPITESNYRLATKAWWMPPPGLPGSFQSVTVPNLPAGQRYFFALKTRDDQGNWSLISNLAVHEGNTGNSVNVELGGFVPMISEARPNPAWGATRFALTVPEPMTARVEVFDVRGRRIRTLLQGQQPAGNPDLEWDRRDDSGRTVGPGLFFVRGQIGQTSFVRRVSLI